MNLEQHNCGGEKKKSKFMFLLKIETFKFSGRFFSHYSKELDRGSPDLFLQFTFDPKMAPIQLGFCGGVNLSVCRENYSAGSSTSKIDVISQDTIPFIILENNDFPIAP